MVVLLLETSQVFGLFLKDYLFETTEVFSSGKQTRGQICSPRVQAFISVSRTTKSDQSQNSTNSL